MTESILSASAQAALRDTLDAKAAELEQAGAEFAQVEFVDINGYVRGKLMPLRRGLSPSGSAANSLIHAILSDDTVCLTPNSSFDNSFPKLTAVPDPSTIAQWSWRPDTASVFCDLYGEDGVPAPLDCRGILRAAEGKAAALGFEIKAALEYEFFLFQEQDDLIRQGRHTELVPLGRVPDPYSVSRSVIFDDLARDYFRRTRALGIPVEAFHTEYGVGMYEYAFEPEGAVKAADNAARGKLYMKQLASEHGLVASFMAAVGMRESDTASGVHHNISVWQDGRNLMWDPEQKQLSKTARHFAAGVLATMPDLHLFFRPTVNSYRRMDRHHFSPENASWGLDHHTAAIRVVHGAAPERQARIEHRVPGGDVNPYLSIAAILLGGLYGIENQLEPPAYAVGDPVDGGNGAMLPPNLGASIAAFEASAVARELFGDAFVDHYSLVKRGELELFEAWAAENPEAASSGKVTDWERRQYFEWV